MNNKLSEAYLSVKQLRNGEKETKAKLEEEKKKLMTATKKVQMCLNRGKRDMENMENIRSWLKKK